MGIFDYYNNKNNVLIYISINPLFKNRGLITDNVYIYSEKINNYLLLEKNNMYVELPDIKAKSIKYLKVLILTNNNNLSLNNQNIRNSNNSTKFNELYNKNYFNEYFINFKISSSKIIDTNKNLIYEKEVLNSYNTLSDNISYSPFEFPIKMFINNNYLYYFENEYTESNIFHKIIENNYQKNDNNFKNTYSVKVDNLLTLIEYILSKIVLLIIIFLSLIILCILIYKIKKLIMFILNKNFKTELNNKLEVYDITSNQIKIDIKSDNNNNVDLIKQDF